MNGSFGPNKLYQDLAYGLALNGVATIRYNKRTLTYGKQLAAIDSFTLYDETIDDAISAVNKASEYFYLDTNRIYVLGHSLGAFASPIIASENPAVDGIILLAGSPKPYYQMIPKQYQYLSAIDSVISEEEQERIDRAIEERKLIDEEATKVEGLKEMGNDDMIYYHRHMKTFDIIDSIKTNEIKTFIVQGDRDYQVPHQTEYQAFLDELGDTPWVKFALIEGANHQMVEWTGKPTPGEYYKQGHIDFNTIKLLSDWILGK
jgi:esterase/lipase